MSRPSFRLAAIDLDGTLLGPDGRVGSRNRAAVNALVEAGVVVLIASGRMHAASLPTHQELGLTTPIVSYNGAMVFNPVTREMIQHLPLDADIARELVLWGEASDLHLNYYHDDHLYVREETRWSRLYNERTGSIIEPVGSLQRFTGSPTKIILVDEPHVVRPWMETWQGKLGERAYLINTAAEYLEFLNPLANKWQGIMTVAERLGIEPEDIAAFGDSPNDLPMLLGAGIGVVMPHAAPEILAAADFVGEGTPEDAFAHAVAALLPGFAL